jgi:serine/threonine protein kinase
MVSIIGEGTFGCVTKPSLKCTTPQKYKHRVSKIMKFSDAQLEMKDMQFLSDIPNIHKYMIRIPTMCKPLLNKELKSAVSSCTNKKVNNTYNKEKKQLRLLLLDDGGVDLDVFSTEIIPTLSKKDCCIFITAILQLIKGVEFFRANGIVHFDVKMQNIVYDVKTGKIRFIDFGMVVKKKEYITQSLVNANERAQSWSYYPPENSCAQKYIFDHGEKCKGYRKRALFDTFLEKTVNTFDSYCLTYCLIKLFQQIEKNTGNMFPTSFYETLQPLLRQFCNPDVLRRNDNLDFLATQYKMLLVKHEIYVIQKPSPSPDIIHLADNLSLLNLSRESNSMSKKMKKIRCKSGKIRNKITGRCVTHKRIKR